MRRRQFITDIAGEQRLRCKSAQLVFVVAIEAGKLLVQVGQNKRLRRGTTTRPRRCSC
jgi:hypothetical protein